MELIRLLQKMVDAKASDMFVTAGMPVAAKINGELLPIEEVPLSADDALAIVLACMNDKQKNEYLTHKECNFAIANDAGRFRVSAFFQRDQAGMVVRRIVTKIPDVDELGLPSILKELIMSTRSAAVCWWYRYR